MVPSSFRTGDGTIGWHSLGQLVWRVKHNRKSVEVWLDVERREALFTALIEHISPEIISTYKAIKRKITAGIKKARNSQNANVYVRELPNLVIGLSGQPNR